MMAQLESTFGFKHEVNSTSLHIQRESDITSDTTNDELPNNESELKLKQEVDDNMEHTFFNVYEKLFTIKEELFDITEHQEETDSAQHQLEPKQYKVNTDLQIQRELLINEYEDSEFKDVKNVTIKCEILDRTEQSEEADLQVLKPILIIKKNDSDEEGTIDDVSKASEPTMHKDRVACETIKQEKDLSVTPLSYGSNSLSFRKELRVVLENVMLTVGKHDTQDSFEEATNNAASNIKAESVKNKEIGTQSAINKRTLTNYNNMDTDSASTAEAAKFIHPGLENLDSLPNNKKVCARTSTVNGNIDFTHYDAESLKNIFICEFCYKSFKKKNSLYQHIKGHLNLFYCTYCNYTAHTKVNLNRHINTKHTKNTVYNCSYCSYKAYVKSTLSRHVNSKHTKNTVYNCSYCDYKTSRKGDLSRHINAVHAKINVFHCSYCKYKTYNKNTLPKHIDSRHTKNTVLKCGQLDRKRKHIKAKHNI